jgi:hypothetical protein
MTVPSLPPSAIGLVILFPRLGITLLCTVVKDKAKSVFSITWIGDDTFDLAMQDCLVRETTNDFVLSLTASLGFDPMEENLMVYEIPLQSITNLISLKKVIFINPEDSMGWHFAFRLLSGNMVHHSICDFLLSQRLLLQKNLANDKLDRSYRFDVSPL